MQGTIKILTEMTQNSIKTKTRAEKTLYLTRVLHDATNISVEYRTSSNALERSMTIAIRFKTAKRHID